MRKKSFCGIILKSFKKWIGSCVTNRQHPRRTACQADAKSSLRTRKTRLYNELQKVIHQGIAWCIAYLPAIRELIVIPFISRRLFWLLLYSYHERFTQIIQVYRRLYGMYWQSCGLVRSHHRTVQLPECRFTLSVQFQFECVSRSAVVSVWTNFSFLFWVHTTA